METERVNLFKVGNVGGRPPKYDNPEDLEAKIIEYFDWVQGEYEIKEKKEKGKTVKYKHWIREPENITVTGIALFLGFSDKSSFYDYEKKEEFSHLIKRARTIIENRYENGLISARSPVGAIFALKNMGWKDQVHQEVTQTNITLDMGSDDTEEYEE